MTYKVQSIPEETLEQSLNEIEAEGWALVSVSVPEMETVDGRPVYVTIWHQ